MHILKAFIDKRTHTFRELLEISNLEESELSKKLEHEISKKRISRKKDSYTLKPDFFVGTIDLKEHFGFLLLDEKDLYLEERDLYTALDKDIVLVRKNKFNKVIEIIERHEPLFVVTVHKIRNKTYIIPKKHMRFSVYLDRTYNFIGGEVLYVKLKEVVGNTIIVSLMENLGFETDPGMDILSLVYEMGFPYGFSKEALKEAEDLNREIDHKGRTIFNNELIVTIDGEDAKDLDDAISLSKVDEEYHLSVHIADVSHYVKEQSQIDIEALNKATSAYLADRVIPMLPRRLSNDLCSLNAGEEKYALSVMMILDKDANLLDYKIVESVIRVTKRLSYEMVNRHIKGETVFEKDIAQMIDEMLELSQKLEEKRKNRGSITFESLEYKYILNDDGEIDEIRLRESGASEMIIESFMILTNEVVSEHLTNLEFPCIYRIHEKPKEEKLRLLYEQLKPLGIKLPRLNHFTPKAIQKILDSIIDHEQKLVINELFLKAMNRAVYDKNNVGHFGLASTFYSHFTSPIRRYPDLLLHRLVKTFIIHPNKLLEDIKKYDHLIPMIAKKSTDMEKLAVDLEREVDKLKIAEYMDKHIGEIFEGSVSGMTKTGMFVRTKQGIEGMIPLRTMDDFYILNEKNYTLVGKQEDNIFHLGSKVQVKLIDVDISNRQITFKLVK